jgi:hypothetical protein
VNEPLNSVNEPQSFVDESLDSVDKPRSFVDESLILVNESLNSINEVKWAVIQYKRSQRRDKSPSLQRTDSCKDGSLSRLSP